MKHTTFASVSSELTTLALLMTFAVIATSCASPTPTVMTTATPSSMVTPPPISTSPALLPEFVIADFDSCNGMTNLGGALGAAYDPSSGDKLVESYVQEAGRSCVARIEYDIVGWSAFWIQLQGADLSPYSQLVFDIKADPQEKVPKQVKIELKRAGGQEVSIMYISGITTDWQTMSVNLGDFGSTGYTSALSSLTDMKELVFTFEASQSGKTGVIYLDNIALR
jgi:hypothetical protein